MGSSCEYCGTIFEFRSFEPEEESQLYYVRNICMCEYDVKKCSATDCKRKIVQASTDIYMQTTDYYCPIHSPDGGYKYLSGEKQTVISKEKVVETFESLMEAVYEDVKLDNSLCLCSGCNKQFYARDMKVVVKKNYFNLTCPKCNTIASYLVL